MPLQVLAEKVRSAGSAGKSFVSMCAQPWVCCRDPSAPSPCHTLDDIKAFNSAAQLVWVTHFRSSVLCLIIS
jgi:hypothetical protein